MKLVMVKKVVIGKSNLDSPEGPRSRKTFDNLVEQMSKESSKWTDHKVVLETIGKRKKIKGINSFLNETRIDGHNVAKKDFGAFYQEMQPIHSEVILSYQKGIIKQGSEPQNVVLKKETLAWVEDDQDYLKKLRNKRIFEQAAEYYEGEKLLAERTMRRTKQRVFAEGEFRTE